jgi:hypothetical protein
VSGRDQGAQGGQYDDAAQRGYGSQRGSHPPPGWDDQMAGYWQAPGEYVGPDPGGSSRDAPGSGFGQPLTGSRYYADYGRPAAGSSHGQATPGHGQSTPGYDQPTSGYDQPLPGQGDAWYGQQQAPGYQQMPPGMADRSRRAHSRRLLAWIAVPSVIVIVAAVSAAVLLTGGHKGTQYPEAGKTAVQILADMRAAAASPNETVHVVGTFTPKGQTIDLDVHAGAARGYGTLRLKNYSIRVVVVGSTVYFTGSAGFWRSAGTSARRARALAGKWVQASASNPHFKQIAQLVLLGQLVKQLKPSGTAVKVRGVTDVNGTPAVALRDSSDGSLLYVAVRGPVLPLRVTGPHGQGGAINFTGYGKPVTVTAPHAAISVP